MASQQLPEDLLIEILIRLPLKSIQRFKCVSKYWCDLIRSSVFIDRHQKRDRKQSVLLVKRYVQDGIKDVFSFHDPDFPDVLVSADLLIPIPDDLNKSARYKNFKVHGPCNGLVCVALCETVFLCNPSLREFRLLPPQIIAYPKGYLTHDLGNGFGFDPNTGAYKFVQFWVISHRNGRYQDRSEYPLNNTLRIDLYNSTSNSWKQIDPVFPLDLISWHPNFELFFNNAIHWSVGVEAETYEVRILCFDTSTEAFRLMDFPDDFVKMILYSSDCLMVLNESLAMALYQEERAHLVDIWVMNEYGVKESWTKQFVIGPYSIVFPLFCLRDEWLLCESENGLLVACALHENEFKEFGLHGWGESLRAIVYEESLISLEMIIPGDRMHCSPFSDKDGKVKTGLAGRMWNRISVPRLLKLNPLDSHMAWANKKFRNTQFSCVKDGSHKCYQNQVGLKNCYCYKVFPKGDSTVDSCFMHEKFAVSDSPEAPLVVATPMKVSSFSISSSRLHM